MIVKVASILFLGGILVLGLMVLPVSVHGSEYVATHEENGILSNSYIEFTSDGDFTDYELDSVSDELSVSSASTASTQGSEDSEDSIDSVSTVI